jgi:hypothetical protein
MNEDKIRLYPNHPFSCAQLKLNAVGGVRKRTIPTEKPLLVGEVSANFYSRGCHVVSVMDPYGHILGFLDQNRYFFYQVAQLYPRG